MATITEEGESTKLENTIKNCSRIQIIQSLVMTLIQQILLQRTNITENNQNQKITLVMLMPSFIVPRTKTTKNTIFRLQCSENVWVFCLFIFSQFSFI